METRSFANDDTGLICDLLEKALQLIERDDAARGIVAQALTLADRSKPPRMTQGGLAAWQVKRVVAYVDSNLGHTQALRCETVADLTSLSTSYFSRAFKTSFGFTFSQYVMQRRVERAKQMLLGSDAAIATIALECGLSDQSHLTRLFKKIVGAPPSAWRRSSRFEDWTSAHLTIGNAA